jgi:hypothetical protein
MRANCSEPGRPDHTTSSPSLWIWTRKPSNLISCCQSSPTGGARPPAPGPTALGSASATRSPKAPTRPSPTPALASRLNPRGTRVRRRRLARGHVVDAGTGLGLARKAHGLRRDAPVGSPHLCPRRHPVVGPRRAHPLQKTVACRYWIRRRRVGSWYTRQIGAACPLSLVEETSGWALISGLLWSLRDPIWTCKVQCTKVQA